MSILLAPRLSSVIEQVYTYLHPSSPLIPSLFLAYLYFSIYLSNIGFSTRIEMESIGFVLIIVVVYFIQVIFLIKQFVYRPRDFCWVS